MNKKLTREEWYERDAQYNQTPAIPEKEKLPGEHLILIGMLNRFGMYPMSKQEAMKIAQELLEKNWQ